MAAEYRAPKAVLEEATANSLELVSRISSPLSIEDVVEIRNGWIGHNGVEWAQKITDKAQERVAVVLKGSPMTEMRTTDTSVNDIVSQIDALVDSLMEKLGIPDADDETETAEMNSAVVEPQETRADEETDMEERKSVIDSAEKITMDVEIRSVATDDGSLKIAGYAATFNQEADGLNFREQIAQGAFKRSLEGSDPIFLLVNHQYDQLPLASTRSGTLRLSEDSKGLALEADLDPSNPRSAELASALTRGDVSKMSFSFKVNPGGETREGNLRTLTDLKLFEVSVVNMPAYSSTDVGMRSAEDEAALELRKRTVVMQLELAKARI